MTDTPAETPKPKRSKFKYTRELVRIAVEDGMTQKQIADLCRVEQSVVSAWQNGRSTAFEHQIAELRRRYGSRLNRTTSRVYLVREPTVTASGRWEDTERAKSLLAMAARAELLATTIRDLTPQPTMDFSGRPQAILESPARLNAKGAPDGLTVEQMQAELEKIEEQSWAFLREHNEGSNVEEYDRDHGGWCGYTPLSSVIFLEREAFETPPPVEQLTVVEGLVLFRYSFMTYRMQLHGKTPTLAPVPIARWVLHHVARDRFVLVQQARRTFVGAAQRRWAKTRRDLKNAAEHRGVQKLQVEALLGNDAADTVESSDDFARWISTLHGPMDSAAVLAFCDAYLADHETVHGPTDEVSLPFLLRKALIEHGYEVPGVVRIVASE